MNEKIRAYKQSLKSPYTGMTEELMNKISDSKINIDKVDADLNRDGKVDKKDMSLAGKVLAESKKQINKVK